MVSHTLEKCFSFIPVVGGVVLGVGVGGVVLGGVMLGVGVSSAMQTFSVLS